MNLDFLRTYASALAAFSGAVGVKLVETLINKRSDQFNEASKIREELRDELSAVREENVQYRAEANDWRQKYYEKSEEFLRLQTEFEAIKQHLDQLVTKMTEPEEDKPE